MVRSHLRHQHQHSRHRLPHGKAAEQPRRQSLLPGRGMPAQGGSSRAALQGELSSPPGAGIRRVPGPHDREALNHRVVTPQGRLREVAAPGWRRWVSQTAIAWALGYGVLRIYWALGAAPSPPDLVAFTGWGVVVLCGAAAVVVLALRRARWSWPLAAAAWGVAAALVAASALVLLDVVGLILPGVGPGVHPVAFVSRAACLAGGVLVGATALCYQRHWRGACLSCGRTGQATWPARPPRWAWLAAWAAVAGCLVRLLAQVAVGLGVLLRGGGSMLGFEAGFLLAGTVLPLALVYRWGREFPGWVPLLAGRGVPRWLVLGPALGLGVGMTAYFGMSIVRFAAETVTGTWQQHAGTYPLWFFWVAMPAYLVWGLGLGTAALAYRSATHSPCRTCGR
jgi:hypothetical protein